MNTLNIYLFNKKFLFTFCLCFVSISSFSQPPIENPSNGYSYYWDDLRQSLDEKSVSGTQKNIVIAEQFDVSYQILNLLLNQQIFQDHFISKIQKTEDSQLSAEDNVIAMKFINQLLQTLRVDSPEKIEKFMSDQNFTKTDKLLSLLVMIFNNESVERVMDLIGMLGLSVNDSLNLKNVLIVQ